MINAVLSKDGKKLVLEVDLAENPTPSQSSGKNLICASTHGFVSLPVQYKGREIRLGLNVMIPSK